ncbi:MBG domain-containing protein [Belliella marina]|uniref:MBG domain-containing protein n=1 Tax=Belliella marina TaxID=1644146 RepID=A0ABW4VTE8_9BACT
MKTPLPFLWPVGSFTNSRSIMITMMLLFFSIFSVVAQISPTNNILYINKNVSGGNQNGSSWANALPELRDALSWAATGWDASTNGTLQIWVAEGIYTPTASPTDRDATFQLVNGVELYGGFDPDNGIEDLTHDRILPSFGGAGGGQGTILSGDIDTNDTAEVITDPDTQIQGNNSYTVVNGSDTDNTAKLDGFTITAGNADVATTIADTSPARCGGGIYINNGSPVIAHTTVAGNKATAYGGGLFMYGSGNPVLTHLNISHNKAGSIGGGVSNLGLNINLTISHSNIAENTANSLHGGGIYNSGTLNLTNTTLSGNTAGSRGGGILNWGGTTTLSNTIVWGNTAGNEGNEIYNNSNPSGNVTLTLSNCLYPNGGIYDRDNGGTITFNETNILHSDPQFTDAANGDFALQNTSAAINAGDNTLYTAAGSDLANDVDLAGNPRVYDYADGGIIDIGAYEYQGELFSITPTNGVLYVDKNVSGGNQNGSSWANALPELADALKWANDNKANWTNTSPLQIYVAKGTYKPQYKVAEVDDQNNPTTDRDKSFLMVPNVQLYGGFDPENSITTLDDDRELPSSGGSVLSGDIGTENNNADNTYHVVLSLGAVGTALLDGFTITGGNADGGLAYITVNTKIIWLNSGGGMYNDSSSPVLTNVTISGNTASDYGGGIVNAYTSSPVLTNVIISGNTTGGYGGGMDNSYSASPVLTNVTISGNTATYGGGIFNKESAPVLTNVTISGNRADDESGGIYNQSSSSPLIRNSIIYNNNTGIKNTDASSSPSISYSLVQGINSTVDGNIDGSIDPLFTDVANGDYTLQAVSPVIDAGNSALFAGLDANTQDLAGNLRLMGDNIDMGAYEFQGEPAGQISPTNGVLYVDINVDEVDPNYTGDGSSWENALPQLADALKWARKQHETDNNWLQNDFLQIYVAQGTYKPLYNAEDGQYSADGGRDNAFVMVKNVQLYGGFDPANGIVDLTHDRILPSFGGAGGGTILSGDLDANDTPGIPSENDPLRNDNAYHVLISAGDLENALLDGFSVMGGHANIWNNGRVDVWGTSIDRAYGGGLYIDGNGLTVSRTAFSENLSFRGGGVVGIYNASADFLNSTFINNYSPTYGGGISLFPGGTFSIVNGLIANNTAYNSGGGIGNSGTLNLTNTTLSGNTAGSSGGGIFNYPGSTATLSNTILWGNTAGNQGDEIFTYSDEFGNVTLTSTNCLYPNNAIYNNDVFGGTTTVNETDILDRDPQFTDPANGDFSLQNTSPAINMGDNTLYTTAGGDLQNDVDLAGNTRLIGTNIDMGAFEFQQLPQTITFNSPPTLTYGDVNIGFDVSTTSGLPITYSLNDNDFVSATSNGSGLNALQATESLIEITVSVAGNETYEATNVTVSIPVGRLQLEIAAPIISPKEYDGTTDVILELGSILNQIEVDVLQVDFTAFFDNPDAGSEKTITVQFMISGTDADNYLAPNTFISNEGIITPATITGITFEDQSFVFDGTEKTIEITGTLPEGTSVAYSDNTRTNVGTQEATATITGANFTTVVLTADLTIIPADILGIGFEDASFTYDGTAKSIEIMGTLPAGTSVAYSDNTRTSVGTHEATATITGSNFTTLVLTAELTITPADISGIVFEDASFIFDGTAKTIEITGTLPAGTSVAYSDNARTNVGTQEATATITGSNFNDLVLTADLTITPADISGIVFEDASFTYDGTAKSIEITGTLPAGTSVAYSDNSRTNVGIQEATATITGSNFTTLVLTADLTITPAEITGITFEDASFIFDGTEKTIEITGTLPEGTSVAYSDNTRTNVGTQEATATITGANFTTLVLTADLTITPADISGITFDDASFVFDGTEKTIEITGALPEGASVAYSDYARTNVGTQEATATITGSNFTTLVLTADLTIVPADISGIGFDDASFIFDGTAKIIEITGTLPTGTSVAYTDNTRTNVGTQEATATITGANFTTLVLTADLTITPADISGITFEDGSFIFDGTAKSIEITGTLPAGTSVAYTDNTRTNVGTQEATATITGSNFTTLVLTADLTITPAVISGITFDDASFVFDGTEKSIEIMGTLPAGTSIAYSENSRTNVGTHEATATITGSNFTTLVLTADLTITPADISGITFEDASFIFDGTEKSIEITGTLPEGTSVAYSDNTRINVGTQQATATITGSNFTTLVLTADLTITPADISGITFEDASFTYDGTAKSIEITGTLPEGTSAAYSDNTRTNVGTQETTAAITGSNFTTLVLTADLTITPADISGITFDDASFVFDGTEKTIEITGTLPEGTSVAYSDNTRTNVGSQEVTATITGSNFTTLVLTADLTITPTELAEILVDDEITTPWSVDPELPGEVDVLMQDGQILRYEVAWDKSTLNLLDRGTYSVSGTVNLPTGVLNPSGKEAILQVIVLPKPAPTGLTLSNNRFVPDPNVSMQEIGSFTVIDEIDQIHTVELVPGAGDNVYFEISGDVLYWSSSEEAAGRMEFRILARVTDRDGNVMERSFTILRDRKDISEITVFNTFSPNGDGVNDTWGVPDLKYYVGGRVQVFDKGGERLFYTESPEERWDGTHNGKQMPVGTYYWVLESRETGEIRRGVLTILKN